MTMTPQVTPCPHCGAANPIGSAFCESCGKALAAVRPGGPRIVAGDVFATTGVGARLQADELHAQMKKATNALLTVAIVQTAFGAFIYFVLTNTRGAAAAQLNTTVVFGTIFGIAALFWGLYFWARRSPLPAAIVGLVVYASLWAFDLISYFSTVSDQNGAARPGAGPFNGIIIRIIIIGVLARAVGAGMKHRELMRRGAV